MKFESPPVPGRLVWRYKRFLADIELDDGRVVTAHCPNSGSMKTCATPGSRVRLSAVDKPSRKLKYTWDLVHNGRCWIGINTLTPNRIVDEALGFGQIPELAGYTSYRREVRYGDNTRFDFAADGKSKRCFIEVKNVTLVESDGYYRFPDAVTVRGRKHLIELIDVVQNGGRAVILFVIQRSDGSIFAPARQIDPVYAATLNEAYESGVEILPYMTRITETEVVLTHRVDFDLSR